MPRILHTADWQLGLKLRFVDDERAAVLRDERLRAVRRIARLAKQERVDVVVVAGDVLDDPAVPASVVQGALDALRAFGDIPVLLLPGNHDAGRVLESLARAATVLLTPEPIEVAGITFLPCPLTERHTRFDPTAWVPDRAGPGLRVVVAHGTVLDFDERTGSKNRIDLDALLAKNVDYVALGDWHGLRSIRANAWYPGTPEPTRFTEKQPGHVLIVDLDAGAAPVVTPHEVAETRWISRLWPLDGDEDVTRLVAWLDQLPEKTSTLIELRLEGAITLGARAELDAAIESEGQRLALLRVNDEALFAQPSDVDLSLLRAEGFVGDAARRLGASEDPQASEALRLLYRWLQQCA